MKKGMMITAVMMFLGVGITTAVFAERASEPVSVIQSDEVTYNEIQKEDLPEAVTAALNETYAGYSIEKAFSGSDGTYKVKLLKGDEKIAVFYNADGEFIKVKTMEEK